MTRTEAINETLSRMGFELKSSKATAGDYPQLQYDIELLYKGKSVIKTDFSLGIGHVDLGKLPRNFQIQSMFTSDEESMLHAWANKPQANFKDKEQQLGVAVKLANWQKLTPDLADVTHCLLSDGAAFFQAQSFGDWASEFGYDADSRKAEAIYRACDNHGRQLAAKLDVATLNRIRELTEEL